MQKVTVLSLGFSLLLVFPAMGQLGRVWTEFQFYSVDMQNYLRNNLSETLSPLEISGQNAVNNSLGELNIPNPIEAGKSFRQDIFFNPTTDNFENNPVVQSNSVSNEINRLITRSAVESLMGRDGQIRLKVKLEETENTIRNINEIVDDAEESSQNLIFQISQGLPLIPDVGQQLLAQTNAGQVNLQLQTLRVQSDQSKFIGETLSQTIQTNQFLQYSNLNLANISQEMAAMNRSRRVDSATETARLIRTTSQVDLFGREEN
ncbi:hypothetical protein VB620_06605 [Nodularia harveyana UHCC-0300]|uniref:Uncharacterized protein n=1 Tax=Nodularia harveyana UHCC-0300 TaxID=2974287 RepID=A0ABU5UD14_9CYAN|nr:hypothetical protein [Nodularia harveyana]MEA5581010.1 hypothetical protein [Nodularia harveyana UHCC-0300]